ncbi:hypothetical protein RJ55_02912 [Drechmeria coniospora]|nr:hypothetical protein RJ55_02912 [Drechmeria coniospora]
MLPDTRRRVRPLVALPVEQEQDEKDSGFVVAIVAWARGATQPGAMTDAGAFSSAHVENLATCSDVIDLQVTKTPRVAKPNAGMGASRKVCTPYGVHVCIVVGVNIRTGVGSCAPAAGRVHPEGALGAASGQAGGHWQRLFCSAAADAADAADSAFWFGLASGRRVAAVDGDEKGGRVLESLLLPTRIGGHAKYICSKYYGVRGGMPVQYCYAPTMEQLLAPCQHMAQRTRARMNVATPLRATQEALIYTARRRRIEHLISTRGKFAQAPTEDCHARGERPTINREEDDATTKTRRLGCICLCQTPVEATPSRIVSGSSARQDPETLGQ